jgi:GTP-binding protein
MIISGGVFRPKMRYAHQGGSNPPLIIIHGSALDKVPESYRRYLEKTFCDAFKLQGTPLKVEFRAGANPFADNKPKKVTESERREGLKLADRVRKRAWREPKK